MRKEFEENEESKKTLENNLEIQDEIDDETFQKILEEEFIERERQIEEALFADEDFEDLKLTDKEVQDSYQELMRRFEEEKKESAEFSEELVPDEKKVLSMEEVRERGKKAAGGLHRLGRVVGMAVVAVACVFAASMTSEANRTYLVNSVRIWSGDDSKIVVYNDENNEDASTDEEKAIVDIEEKLGVKIPEFYYRPYEFEFSNYVIDETTSLARIEYEYQNNSVTLYIDKQNLTTASKINSTSGNEKDETVIYNGEIAIVIKKNYDSSTKEISYSAEWNKDGNVYLLSGRIKLEELEKILKYMKI